MFRLQVTAPAYLILKCVIVLLQDRDRIRISHMSKIGIQHMVQTLDQPLIHKLVEEVHLLRCILQHVADDVLQHRLCQHHVVCQICKSDFRLDHPELGRMSRRVGILRTEGRSEGIYILKCKRISFHIQLTTDSQIRLFAEKVLAVVHFAVLCQRQIVQIECSYLEHLPRAFTIAARDDRRMHIYKASLLEKGVDRVSDQRPYPEHGLESICPRTQVRDRAQIFKAVPLLLQRIVRR